MKGLIGELCPSLSLVCICCNSQSAIPSVNNQNTFYRRTKYIEIKYNFIRDEIEYKRLTLIKIATKDNPTDMMTKSLIYAKFSLCVDLIGVLHHLVCDMLVLELRCSL